MRQLLQFVGRRAAALAALAAGSLGMAGSMAVEFGSPNDPGTGMWPLIVSCLTVLGSLVLLVRPGSEDHEPFTGGTRAVAAATAGMVGYAVLFPHTGFTLPAFLLLAFWIRVLGKEPWRLTLAVSAASSTAFFCLFSLVLNVPLPRDLIWGI
ncbi:tripartite tricarboxylate transporter TctB family protein [Actinomadura madurae]|uniref:tripartite tricarboxylate transporter TctB family protein n=2 Tax=Actinomadura madurae TaxID=1993 RepID=UPI002025C030|nr:tripartite tricarboxylate transporter TctB family protein [Actinomadura madurae]MCP9953547.1 tripartite tricarboxylate transporter TctB family protein [Actinomadura madurae]MCP9982779.1 tripartite tricarboxylate transporter TctB family protein [Actinomadura madurae]MCQ0005671.1 tripartite tricarboxylate transporter TctB family protein [Actinomadura madurae]MCQ0019016.1 tripartite tricarboxylate transporter TctB family protein [Actinomadura madurae]URM99029.1 tripartite tricarboxylate transp